MRLKPTKHRYIPNDPNIWQTKDGRQIPIAEMDDNHLSNAIKYVDNKLETERKTWLDSADRYAKAGDETIAECMLDRALALTHASFFPQYDALVEERVKRNGMVKEKREAPF